jgi:hypothetical protein
MLMGADGWSALAGVSSTVLALAAVTVALIAFRSDHRRARFESARTLHHDLTTGEVAAARKTVGSLHYGEFGAPSAAADWRQALTSYFTLLWCFERIEAGRTALVRGAVRTGGRKDEAVDYLDALVKPGMLPSTPVASRLHVTSLLKPLPRRCLMTHRLVVSGGCCLLCRNVD